jgi:large subunit ribosomal protein L28
MVGNKVSHSNVKTRKRVLPNLTFQRFWIPSEKRWIRLKVSARAKRIIARVGIEQVLADMRKNGTR